MSKKPVTYTLTEAVKKYAGDFRTAALVSRYDGGAVVVNFISGIVHKEGTSTNTETLLLQTAFLFGQVARNSARKLPDDIRTVYQAELDALESAGIYLKKRPSVPKFKTFPSELRCVNG